MKKRIIMSLAVVTAVAIGVVGMSAFEAHIINVTAQIENALSVDTDSIEFGTVFPQEALDYEVGIAMSQSFQDEENADDINYVIRQKPKCMRNEGADQQLPQYGRVTEDNDEFVCVDDVNYTKLPVLCPYLSKHDIDPDDGNDESIDAFHGDMDWTMADTLSSEVAGRLAKSQNDIADLWNIDLRVPCFEGQCAQDWDDFVEENNPGADPDMYVLPNNLEHELFGCDLWIEVTEISRIGDVEPDEVVLSLENKDEQGGWVIETDEIHGTLVYTPVNPTFDFTLDAQVLQPDTEYYLIYYADGWPGNNPGAVIGSGFSDASGHLNFSGNPDLGMDLPDPADANYPGGAKVWVVPASDHDGVDSMTTWNPTEYLYEYDVITYDDTDIP